jgi:hypothetical protein
LFGGGGGVLKWERKKGKWKMEKKGKRKKKNERSRKMYCKGGIIKRTSVGSIAVFNYYDRKKKNVIFVRGWYMQEKKINDRRSKILRSFVVNAPLLRNKIPNTGT